MGKKWEISKFRLKTCVGWGMFYFDVNSKWTVQATQLKPKTDGKSGKRRRETVETFLETNGKKWEISKFRLMPCVGWGMFYFDVNSKGTVQATQLKPKTDGKSGKRRRETVETFLETNGKKMGIFEITLGGVCGLGHV